MFLTLLIGSLIVSLTVVVQVIFIGGAIRILDRIGPWLAKPPHSHKTMMSLIGVILWLLLALSISIWIWATLFIMLGVFESLESALYFSAVSFTTVGYGDITLNAPWRLLSGISAANGLLLFGLNTAFLVEFLSQLMKAQAEKHGN